MVHKCLRCFIEMRTLDTLYLMKHQLIDYKGIKRKRVETGIPFHIEVCPNCGHAELFKVK